MWLPPSTICDSWDFSQQHHIGVRTIIQVSQPRTLSFIFAVPGGNSCPLPFLVLPSLLFPPAIFSTNQSLHHSFSRRLWTAHGARKDGGKGVTRLGSRIYNLDILKFLGKCFFPANSPPSAILSPPSQQFRVLPSCSRPLKHPPAQTHPLSCFPAPRAQSNLFRSSFRTTWHNPLNFNGKCLAKRWRASLAIQTRLLGTICLPSN